MTGSPEGEHRHQKTNTISHHVRKFCALFITSAFHEEEVKSIQEVILCPLMLCHWSYLHPLNQAIHKEGVLRERLMENLKQQRRGSSI